MILLQPVIPGAIITCLQNNTISGGFYGISVAGDQVYSSTFSNFIYDNKIINNTITDFYEKGIYAIGTFRTVIEGNSISRPLRTTVGDFHGIFIEQTNGDLRINRNRISNPFVERLLLQDPSMVCISTWPAM